MKQKSLQTVPVAVMLVLLMGALIAVTYTPEAESAPPLQAGEVSISAAVLGSKISYQGVLKEGGSPVTGPRNIIFRLYSNNGCASQVGADIPKFGVPVSNGLFDVQLDVNPAHFEGQARWLGVDVGNTGSNIVCQEMLPAPYALSLRPGATINNTATGYALRGESANGLGIYGYSDDNYGVQGSSTSSWGGYFDSGQGYGVRVNSSGTDHYDHGAYVTAQSGYAVYAQSATNQGVRGEAGDVSGIAQPLGAVGVVGLGSNRGIYGASSSGVGLYGTSNSNYGVWGQSTTWYGVTGRTSRSDNNYGFYTPDNILALNQNLMGSMMQVVQNSGSETLSPGDVVAFAGIQAPSTSHATPMVQVAKAFSANSTAVAGVVASRFNLEAVSDTVDSPEGSPEAGLEVTPAGPVSPGEYLLLVVQGPAKVNVQSLSENIVPGALLSTAGQAGFATALAGETQANGLAAAPSAGTVFGKALEPLEAGQSGQIYVFVTLH